MNSICSVSHDSVVSTGTSVSNGCIVSNNRNGVSVVVPGVVVRPHFIH